MYSCPWARSQMPTGKRTCPCHPRASSLRHVAAGFQQIDLHLAADARNELPRVDAVAGVEGELHAGELVHRGTVEHVGHEGDLFDADPVLAGRRAADVDAVLQDLLR